MCFIKHLGTITEFTFFYLQKSKLQDDLFSWSYLTIRLFLLHYMNLTAFGNSSGNINRIPKISYRTIFIFLTYEFGFITSSLHLSNSTTTETSFLDKETQLQCSSVPRKQEQKRDLIDIPYVLNIHSLLCFYQFHLICIFQYVVRTGVFSIVIQI